jgi:hypothetical protein
MRQPTFFIPHGGDLCFFMDWSWPDAWDGLRDWLEGAFLGLPERPKALAIESAHWEADPVRVTTMTSPQIQP